MPYYGEENQNNQWWNGKAWENIAKPNDTYGLHKEMFKKWTYLKELDESNLHPDGCFKCERCRRPHFIVGNFRMLCDGCISVELVQGYPETVEEIKRHNIIRELYWNKNSIVSPEYADELKALTLSVSIQKNCRDLFESLTNEKWITSYTKRMKNEKNQ